MADNNNITEYVRRKLFAMIHTHTHTRDFLLVRHHGQKLDWHKYNNNMSVH